MMPVRNLMSCITSLSFPQPIECVAAIAWEAEKPLDVTTVIVDPPKAGEVRVKARPFMLQLVCFILRKAPNFSNPWMWSGST